MKIITIILPVALFAIAGIVLQGCFKDTCTHTYRLYTPVYGTNAAVRANVKSNAPQPISNPGKIFVKGNYIFLNEIDRGVHIIDNTNPASPKNVAFIDIPGNQDLAVKGAILYADLYTDMVTLDISDPLHAVLKKITPKAFPFRRYANGFIADSSQIVVKWLTRDTTVTTDCSGVSNWGSCSTCPIAFDLAASSMLAASPNGTGGSMARFTIINNNLYTVGDNNLNVYSIGAPENPFYTGNVYIGSVIETIYPFQDKLFIGSGNGMFIYNVASPDKPVKMGQFSHATACDPVIADDKYAFVTLRNGNPRCPATANELDVLSVSNLMAPVLLKTYTMTNPHGLSKDGNTLFVCDGKDGLKVYDAKDVNNLELASSVKGFESYDVIASNKLAIVVAKDRLLQFDYTDINNIRLLSSMLMEN